MRSLNSYRAAGYFTMDTIGSTAFGLMIDSQGDPDNPFIKMANKSVKAGLSPAVLISGKI